MNRYWDLSERERANLTAEQVEAMLTVELMEQGVVKAEPPQLEQVEDIPLEKTQFFQVEHTARYSSGHPFDCVFTTIEQAQAFIDLKPMVTDYDYTIGEKYRYAKPAGECAIKPVQICVEQDVVNMKARLQKIATAKKANEKALAEYNAAVAAVTKATDGIWGDWRDCRAQQAAYQKIIDTRAEYIGICDGDESKANVFLAKAFDAEKIAAALEWFGMSDVACEACEPVEA